ncbi:hypothetical protein BD410DRAFT_872934 [Rickenella mellea]|uniref:Ras-GEF domain-containing protein n=1 Tax=Rickenella mellea TaxID=50990 RepID=A0A4Y7PX74_9AGAM|nr:hypothetical protein BD410DRAFT_872934 [Rickenella mellea]
MVFPSSSGCIRMISALGHVTTKSQVRGKVFAHRMCAHDSSERSEGSYSAVKLHSQTRTQAGGKDDRVEIRLTTRVLFVQVLKLWLKSCSVKPFDIPLLEEMKSFLCNFTTPQILATTAIDVSHLIDEMIAEIQGLQPSATTAVPKSIPRSRDILPTSLVIGLKLLEGDSDKYHTITAFDFASFLPPPPLNNVTTASITNQKITTWVKKFIMRSLLLNSRQDAFKVFVNTAEKSGIFLSSMVALVAGLESKVIASLRMTRSNLDKQTEQCLKKLAKYLDAVENFRAYRSLLSQHKGQCVPWLRARSNLKIHSSLMLLAANFSRVTNTTQLPPSILRLIFYLPGYLIAPSSHGTPMSTADSSPASSDASLRGPTPNTTSSPDRLQSALGRTRPRECGFSRQFDMDLLARAHDSIACLSRGNRAAKSSSWRRTASLRGPRLQFTAHCLREWQSSNHVQPSSSQFERSPGAINPKREYHRQAKTRPPLYSNILPFAILRNMRERDTLRTHKGVHPRPIRGAHQSACQPTHTEPTCLRLQHHARELCNLLRAFPVPPLCCGDTMRQKMKCPLCREPFDLQSIIPVLLDADNIPLTQEQWNACQDIQERIARIDPDSPIPTEFSEKLKIFVEDVSKTHGNTEANVLLRDIFNMAVRLGIEGIRQEKIELVESECRRIGAQISAVKKAIMRGRHTSGDTSGDTSGQVNATHPLLEMQRRVSNASEHISVLRAKIQSIRALLREALDDLQLVFNGILIIYIEWNVVLILVSANRRQWRFGWDGSIDVSDSYRPPRIYDRIRINSGIGGILEMNESQQRCGLRQGELLIATVLACISYTSKRPLEDGRLVTLYSLNCIHLQSDRTPILDSVASVTKIHDFFTVHHLILHIVLLAALKMRCSSVHCGEALSVTAFLDNEGHVFCVPCSEILSSVCHKCNKSIHSPQARKIFLPQTSTPTVVAEQPGDAEVQPYEAMISLQRIKNSCGSLLSNEAVCRRTMNAGEIKLRIVEWRKKRFQGKLKEAYAKLAELNVGSFQQND